MLAKNMKQLTVSEVDLAGRCYCYGHKKVRFGTRQNNCEC
jgi:hypothetical protein